MMDKNELRRLRHAIGSLPVIVGGIVADDNLVIALTIYFEGRYERPNDDTVCDETGWSRWAIERANETLDRIIYCINEEIIK